MFSHSIMRIGSFANLRNISRLLSNGKRKLVLLGFSLLILYPVLYVRPIRNTVFSPFMHYAWRDVETSDFLRIHYGSYPIPEGIYYKTSCNVIRKTTLTRKDINTTAVIDYSPIVKSRKIHDSLSKGHGLYLPSLNTTQKINHLYLYLVMAEALNLAGVKHFLVAGSLLGLSRHSGIIPWDDDLDVSVSFEHWEIVKQTLSCIEGFQLTKQSVFHWKFQYIGEEYPFVDIFFYVMDDKYVWAMTWYTRITYIYPTKFVFPLTEAVFEGIKMPVPYDSVGIAKRIYEYDVCRAFKKHTKGNDFGMRRKYPNGFSVTSVNCRDLSYLYKISNLGRN